MEQDLTELIGQCLVELEKLYPEIDDEGDLKSVIILTKCCETKRSDDFRGKVIERITEEKKEMMFEGVALRMALKDIVKLDPRMNAVLKLYGISKVGDEFMIDIKVIEKLLGAETPVS